MDRLHRSDHIQSSQASHILRVQQLHMLDAVTQRRLARAEFMLVAAQLFEGWLSGNCQRNLLRFVFVDPAARKLIPRWKERARRLLAEFRADYSRGLNDPRLREMVDGLRRDSALFDREWQAQSVLGREGGLRRFTHPVRGPLEYVQHSFTPADRPDYKLVLLVPRA